MRIRQWRNGSLLWKMRWNLKLTCETYIQSFLKKNYILEVGQVYLLYEGQVEVEVGQHIVVQDPGANDYIGEAD